MKSPIHITKRRPWYINLWSMGRPLGKVAYFPIHLLLGEVRALYHAYLVVRSGTRNSLTGNYDLDAVLRYIIVLLALTTICLLWAKVIVVVQVMYLSPGLLFDILSILGRFLIALAGLLSIVWGTLSLCLIAVGIPALLVCYAIGIVTRFVSFINDLTEQ